jgi:nucleotide-binding universal stress UspA family protein
MTAPASAEQAIGAQIFQRVLVGVDDTAAGREAAAQAGRLVAPEGTLELVTAVNVIDARLQGWPQERIDSTLELEGGPALYAAAALVGPRATTRLVNGPPRQVLLDESKRYQATLIAVGSHGHSRLSELLIGGVCGPVLHEAPCSVLIARPATSAALFPMNVLVGIDGSPSSLEALAVGEYLSRGFGVPLRILLARHGDVDIVHAELKAPTVEIVDDAPVDALVDAAAGSDLLIVGNRGLQGLRTLGSVSERVAHKALSSVLVVRVGSSVRA